ncbi:MAG: 50S ribosomal protein L31 [Candidatus Pacebacteria bacterium]|nr:50S ribosomal protein L31 [Candidatus Paceibacterota bacterium]
MKKDTHPTYYPDAVITCACGNKMTIGSTKKETEVEICANCHPFFTGKGKIIDTAGRVEKFKARMAKSKIIKEAKPKGKKKA